MMRSGLDYISEHYGVPAKIGARVTHNNRRGKITGYHVANVRVLFTGERWSKVYHPLDLDWVGQNRERHNKKNGTS